MTEVKNQDRLKKYLAKKSEWLSWYEAGAGESNSLQDQWFAMLLSEMSFRTARQESENNPSSILNTPLLVYLLNSSYFSSQVLATRRLLDPRPDVISLRRLIDDIHKNRHLITREIYVSFDETAYAPQQPTIEIPGMQPCESPFSEWSKSRMRHERFDKLSNVSPEQRSRDDKISAAAFSKLNHWIEASGTSKFVILSHKYLAHAAQQSTIKDATPKNISFAEVEGIQKAIVQCMRAIYDIILSSGIYSEVVPMVQLGFFGQVWDGEKLIESTTLMDKRWRELAKERNQWVMNLDEEFFS